MCWCEYSYMSVPKHVCGGERIICKDQVSSSITWILGIKLRLSGLAASPSTPLSHLSGSRGWIFLKQRFASSRSLLDNCCSYRLGFSSTYGRCLVPLGVWKEVGWGGGGLQRRRTLVPDLALCRAHGSYDHCEPPAGEV